MYGIGDPKIWTAISLNLDVGQTIKRKEIIKRLILIDYERKDIEFKPGIVRV
ncbi:MAG: hypothetical protein KAW66_08445 [Candidatus Lokiarchaeota archaeon]|nr:hypothetical protein [Candidatus Lokiarchaeota archaeon]